MPKPFSQSSRSPRPLFHFVRLWQEANQAAPTLEQRVLATSAEHALVLVMKEHHLRAAARASVSYTAFDEPLLCVVCLIVKGDKRSWKQDYHNKRV